MVIVASSWQSTMITCVTVPVMLYRAGIGVDVRCSSVSSQH